MKYLFCLMLLLILSKMDYAQPALQNLEAYRASVVQNGNNQLIKINKKHKGIQLDLVYASPYNFVKKAVYPQGLTYTFLRKPAYKALLSVVSELQKQNLGIKIFDAYRPYNVTKVLWSIVPDERYAANPKNGSYHNRGLAIDLSLFDLKTGKTLNMGTGFDNFSDTAHHHFNALPKEILNNRVLLKKVMEQYGFKALESEWWHYTFKTDTIYSVLNIPFDDLE
jgi:D-alanyl-D-alanine dipeptidase